jgi:hypothetical protein
VELARLNALSARGAWWPLRRFAPLAVVAAIAAFLLFSPIPWPCPFLLLTGLPCPTCGITRATRLALHLRFADATRMHPAWIVLDPLVGGVLLAEVLGYARTGVFGATRAIWKTRAARVGLALVVGATIALWLARFAGHFGGPVPHY